MNPVSRAILDRWHRHTLRFRVHTPFAILTNNCWGAGFYGDLGVPYNTPFVGTLVPPEDYLRFLGDVPGHLAQPLRFVEKSRQPWRIRYPVGMIGDVEIHFKHHASPEEAREKWTRRLARFPSDPAQWRVKFCDHHVPLELEEAAPLLRAFDALPFPHRVCLLGRRHPALANGVVLRECLPTGRVPDGHAAYRVSLRYFDAARWLNGATPAAAGPPRDVRP